MKLFTRADGFNEEDLLHFGYGHIEAAYALYEESPLFLDSAGYLTHLGTEIVLKACHLNIFGQFRETHNLINLYDELKANDSGFDIGTKNVAFLKELDHFCLLRYPCRNSGPVEIGSDMLDQIEALLDSLWQVFPDKIIEIYNQLNVTEKGGRVMMRRKK